MDDPKMDGGEMLAARARALVGTPFRLHGRDPANGLDCVGLAARAAGIDDVPTGYRLRGGSKAGHAAMLAANGLLACDDAAPGDVLLCRSGAGQFHLAIDAGASVIHADAALGRVVERPGAAPWPIASRWRVGGRG